MIIKIDKPKPKPKQQRISWFVAAAILMLEYFVNHHGQYPPNSNHESYRKPPTLKRWISILGERNSGTRWIFSHIADCFNHSGIEVQKNLTRYKHWFQYDNASKYPHDTLVLAQFRNPYDWLKAMQSVPHHAPAHLGLKWKEFVSKKWTTDRFGLDLMNSSSSICQEDFPYSQIISCNLDPLQASGYNHKLKFSENQPFYEMRPDGTPYDNILELRAAKIRNFVLDVKEYSGVRDVIKIRYEQLLERGTESLLKEIEKQTGVSRQCVSLPSQPERRIRNITRDFLKHINEHLDWSAEALVGYTKRQVRH